MCRRSVLHRARGAFYSIYNMRAAQVISLDVHFQSSALSESLCVCSSNYLMHACVESAAAADTSCSEEITHTERTSSSPDLDAGNFNLLCPRLMCSVVLIIHRFEFTGTTLNFGTAGEPRLLETLFTHRCLYICISS